MFPTMISAAIKKKVEQPRGFFRHIHINHGPELERSIEEVKRVISVNENIRHKYSTRFLAIKLLENDGDLKKDCGGAAPTERKILASATGKRHGLPR